MAQNYSPSASFLARKEQVSPLEKKLLRMSKSDLAAFIMQLVPDEEELEQFLSSNE
ncbi:hypothetical protein ABENE_18975 [Asticcacaulis benevestitus DSM 16100 = ATCC BAA-896]|uniref:Magnesium transporter MgtE intracellular domain-containing protein n=1 Tax=Asticcacaulis benevestitus DSM 16100 = ATCC BAA-896 TaxID=1121022 RepID=V4PIU6_9CAUL|nr:hypothetical protein ABENE_18975 [Asticcacaulis benevestitus DSM 16100 = ATCC BAA-896]